jgi:hypothetical protein
MKKDLEQIIFESGRDSLNKRGLVYQGKLYKQFKIGNYGVANLLAHRRPFYNPYTFLPRKECQKGTIEIFIIKNEKISMSAFLDGITMVRGVQRYLDKKNKEHLYDINLTIIGSELDIQSPVCYLSSIIVNQDEFNFVGTPCQVTLKFLTYHVNLDGLKFLEHTEYVLSNEGF